MNKLISSKHLEGVSDLTLTAPIKQGFIDAFESVTYETRLRLIMKALFEIRQTAREHSTIKPFVDTAERIQALLDFRLAILDGEPRRLLLSATFDRPLEPYMRLIWNPLGPLLDVVFCNCEGYVTASEHSFEDYLAWVRKSQIDSNFFYAASGQSVTDVQYLSQIERLLREGGNPEAALTTVAADPVEEARLVREASGNLRPTNLLGLEALVALYRLADLYPPDLPNEEGNYLLRAAQQLLEGWGREQLNKDDGKWQESVAEQLEWLERELPPRVTEFSSRLDYRDADIQAGIVGYHGGPEGAPILHGAMLLMRIAEPEQARTFIRNLSIATEADSHGGRQEIFRNLAFTQRGLVNIGVDPAELRKFPQEFLEGMEKRAGLLGDLRGSHPRNWKLPRRNWRPSEASEAARAPVDLSEVDIVIQLRTTRTARLDSPPNQSVAYQGHDVAADPFHPLREEVERLANCDGVELLAIETMRRAPERGKEHFGFTDGLSQPEPVSGTPARRDEVRRGEIFWGYANDREDPSPPASPILDNGTFLVVRKLHQAVGRLQEFAKTVRDQVNRPDAVDPESRIATASPPPRQPVEELTEEDLYAKMMGRRRDGTPLAPGATADSNDFDYRDDAGGSHCPLQAHVRRANPRSRREDNHGRASPRIRRSGMSYGPAYDPNEPNGIDRGVFFMAYNASIAEQFEVIQRWINGGNSTGVASCQNDPLMGIAQPGDRRTFQFVHSDGRTIRADIPEPFIELQWGAYLFVPSIAAIEAIARDAPDPRDARREAESRQAEAGEKIIARLLALAEQGPEGRRAAAGRWKTCLEDFASKDPDELAEGPAVWAAIRRFHDGVLRVPYGETGAGEAPRDAVLVAGKEEVMRVFRNLDGHYSMCGQMARMKLSFGPIFLGLDGGSEYEERARINRHIMAITKQDAFKAAREDAEKTLEFAMLKFAETVGSSQRVQVLELDLRRNFITPALAMICYRWFGIPDVPHSIGTRKDNRVDPKGWSWDPGHKPRCPGDFMATSRYCFYPDPVPRVQAYGQAQGQALRKAVREHFEAMAGTDGPSQPIAKAMYGLIADPDELARTLIGVMTGFLPPADASLRWTLYDWLENKILWAVQHALATASGTDFQRASAALLEPLTRAMQKRPSPDMLWRTAVGKHVLGGVEIEPGDRIFVGIVSAMAEDVTAGVVDAYPVFGGDRRDEQAPPPLHACPAYDFAMGTMLGVLSALLDNYKVEALPAPLLVRISDRKGAASSPPAPTKRAEPAAAPAPPTALPPEERARPDIEPSFPVHAESVARAPTA